MTQVLFFSRGRGRGHAVAAIEIAAGLAPLCPAARLRFVSYGAGARTFRERGLEVIDLGLADAGGIAATTVLAGRAIGHLRPDAVVAQEEFAALPAAKIFGKATIFIGDFFGEPGTFSSESLWFADEILFLDRRGVFAEPPSVRGRVRYLGPVLRPFTWSRRRRLEARRELGLDPAATVIGIFPGSWTEAIAPLAARLLPARGFRLLWLAGQDAALIGRRARRLPHVTVLEQDWRIDRLMSACDLAITKTNRMTVRELASLGIRTLSLDYGLNPADTQAIAAIPSNRTIAAADFGADVIEHELRRPEPRPLRFRGHSCAAAIAACLASLKK